MTRVIVLTDRFPERSETFVAAEAEALRRQGCEVRLETISRPADRGEGVADHVWEHDPTVTRLRSMAWLALRHPWRCLSDLRARRRWQHEEPAPPLRMLAPAARRWSRGADVHVHVHFAAGAALCALRIARITGVPWSVTAHAWEIYRRPANLAEKLRAACFVTSGCDYTVRDLRALAGPGVAVHEVVMGVDGQRFARTKPPPDARVVLAVGRLVEKKGFADLVAAARRLREAGRPVRVRIAGAGPLEASLAGDPDVELVGAVDHGEVRSLLERADVLCMPCVVAADGDRDSMPVVVKEALAMQLPVVATDEVGLPEVVRPGWGRLVAPRAPAALAAALDELLSLPAVERAEMGARGREHVLTCCGLDGQAQRLALLIAGARGGRRGARPNPGSSAS